MISKYSKDYIPALDGLRGVAALAVFGVHFQQVSGIRFGSLGPLQIDRLLENGNTGVALFFALSGFLLSLPFWERGAVSGRTPWLAYLARRLARILPAYYLCLTLLVVWNELWRTEADLTDALRHYLLIYNFWDSSFYSINPPFWTIGIEVQFYLILPLYMSLVVRLGKSAGAASLAVLAVAAYGANVWLQSSSGLSGPAESHSLLAHMPHFLLGSMLAAAWRRPAADTPGREGLLYDLMFWGAAVGVVLIIGTALDDLLRIPYGRYNLPLLPVLLAVLVFSASHGRSARATLEWGLLRWVGVVSYGVYLFHLPVMHLVDRAMRLGGMAAVDHGVLFGSLSLLLTLIAATLSYRILERPILNVVRRR